MSDVSASRSSNPGDTLSIDGWRVDRSTLLITRRGRSTKLEPRTMDVLIYLAGRAGETISREELEREIWHGQVVVYEALSNTIAKLRKAFGDNPKHARIIQTVPKIGYRLIADVSRLPESSAAEVSKLKLAKSIRTAVRWSIGVGSVAILGIAIVISVLWSGTWKSSGKSSDAQSETVQFDGKPSIAVLPFTNMSGDPEQDYFADGMTDDLITDLSKISGLLVIARNSTFKYKGVSPDLSQVAGELGVRYVLEGSVRRAGDRVRINAQLIDTKSGGHLWAERFDSSVEDLFAVQDDVTRHVVTALEVRLTENEQAIRARQETVDPDAYDAFLRGRAHFLLYSPEDFTKAVAFLEEAIRLEPGFARAHGVLAAVYWYIWDNEWGPSMGITYDDGQRLVERHLGEALKNPTPLAHHIASRYLTSQGQNEEALAEAERAVALDPNDANGYVALGRIYNRTGRPAEGLRALKKVLRLDPRGDVRGALSYRIGESYFHLEQFEEAAASFLRFGELNPHDEWGDLYLAASFGHLGREKEARAAVNRFDEARAKKGHRPYSYASLDGWVFPNASIRERYREGLRKAGMPQGGALPPPEFRGVMKAASEVKGSKTIDAVEAKSLLDRGVPFVDVSSDSRWKIGHIPRAVHLDLYFDFTEAELAKIVAKDGEVVIYDGGLKSGRTTRAVATAASLGFKKVYFFPEGFPGWKAAGYPVEESLK